MRRRLLFHIFRLSCLLVMLSSCSERVEYTSVEIKDPLRHYYPILQGRDLEIAVELVNTGKVPLLIRDIQPSCGCIVENAHPDENLLVPPGKPIVLTFTYDSKKNVGKVEHTIRIWGNIKPEGMAEMRFDVNVVPDANYHHDYEELYGRSAGTSLREAVTGEGLGRRGYYVDR